MHRQQLISATQPCGSVSLRTRARNRANQTPDLGQANVRLSKMILSTQPCKSASCSRTSNRANQPPQLGHEASLMTSQPCTKRRPLKTPHKLGQLTCTRRQMGRSQVVQVRQFASTTRNGRRQVLSLPPAHGRHSAGQAPQHRLGPVHLHICEGKGQLVLSHTNTLLFWNVALSADGCGTTRRCHRPDDVCTSELICACTILHALRSAHNRRKERTHGTLPR